MRNVVYVPCNASKTTFTILYNPHALLSLNFCLFLVFCYSAIAFSLFRVLYLRISLIHNQKQKKKTNPFGEGWGDYVLIIIFFFLLSCCFHIYYSQMVFHLLLMWLDTQRLERTITAIFKDSYRYSISHPYQQSIIYFMS